MRALTKIDRELLALLQIQADKLSVLEERKVTATELLEKYVKAGLKAGVRKISKTLNPK